MLKFGLDLSWPGWFNFANYACSSVILGSHLILFSFQMPSFFSLKSSISLSTWAPRPHFPLPANVGDIRDVGSIPGWERSPGGGQDNPFQYSCLENPMDRGAWWATVHRVAKSWTWLRQLSMHKEPSRLNWMSLLYNSIGPCILSFLLI